MIGATHLYDVAIIGGGPAGVAAAWTARSLGLSAAVMDISRTERPAEILPAIALSILRTQGIDPEELLGDCPRVSRYISLWNDTNVREHSKISSAFGEDFVVNRCQFASRLRRFAERAGTRWIAGRVIHISRIKRRFLLENANGTTISCHRLIIATGRAAFAALKGNDMLPMDQRVAVYPQQKLTSTKPGRSVQFILESSSHGWWYGLWPEDQTAVPVLVVDADQLPRSSLQEWFRAQLQGTSLLSQYCNTECHALTDLHICSARAFARKTPVGDGWSLVGDARLAIDPLSGNGILRAIQDGARAVQYLIGKQGPRQQRGFALGHAKDYELTCRQRDASIGVG